MNKSSVRPSVRIPELPIEVHRHIIEAVGMPTHPSQYGTSKDQVGDLLNLCLTNSIFHTITAEVLHHRVQITPRNIFRFAERLRHPGRAGLPKVKFLSFTGFEDLSDRVSTSVHSILNTLPPVPVTGILLDMPLRQIYDPDPNSIAQRISKALRRFVNVEEFISVRDEAQLHGWEDGSVFWPSWPKLRRLALYNVELLEEPFIKEIQAPKTLELLCCLNPRRSDMETVEDLMRLFDFKSHPERSFLILDAENYDDSDPDGDYMSVAGDEVFWEPLMHYVAAAPDQLFVVNVDDIVDGEERREEGSAPTDWFSKVAISGKLWDLERFGITRERAKQLLQSPPVDITALLNGFTLPAAGDLDMDME